MFHLSGEGADGGHGFGRHGLARLGFIWGIWTLVGLFFSSQIYFLFLNTERYMPMSWALLWQMTAVYFVAVWTPLVLWLARRYRIERYNWRQSVVVHVLAGTLISTVWSFGHVVMDAWFYGNPSTLTPLTVVRRTFANLDRELLVYWLIVLISYAFNYYQRYREGELRASQAQLQALKMQLHPHFLFNALHSISTLVYKDPEAADQMIARLGDFLRLTLESSATQEVRLQQELEFLDCYLDIERIRFHDRLTTHVDVDPQALNCQVPNLILQPIIENAIRHGIAPRSAPGRIEIRAERRGQVLRLQVRDNGPGLSEWRTSSKPSVGGVGLANTRARLSQLYGAAHRFELSDDPRGGALVTIEIPFISREARADDVTPAELAGESYESYATVLGK